MSSEDPTPVSRGAKALGVLVALRAALRVAGRRGSPPPPPPAPESDIDPSQRTVPSDRRAEAVVATLLQVCSTHPQ